MGLSTPTKTTWGEWWDAPGYMPKPTTDATHGTRCPSPSQACGALDDRRVQTAEGAASIVRWSRDRRLQGQLAVGRRHTRIPPMQLVGKAD